MSYSNRGLAHEAIVEEALIILARKRQKQIPAITGYVHAVPNSSLDRQGIDFLIKLEDATCVPLQVKSSRRGQRKFERHCKKRGVLIPSLVVTGCEQMCLVINRVIQCIMLALNVAQRRLNERIHEKRLRITRKHRTKDWFVRYHAPQMVH